MWEEIIYVFVYREWEMPMKMAHGLWELEGIAICEVLLYTFSVQA